MAPNHPTIPLHARYLKVGDVVDKQGRPRVLDQIDPKDGGVYSVTTSDLFSGELHEDRDAGFYETMMLVPRKYIVEDLQEDRRRLLVRQPGDPPGENFNLPFPLRLWGRGRLKKFWEKARELNQDLSVKVYCVAGQSRLLGLAVAITEWGYRDIVRYGGQDDSEETDPEMQSVLGSESESEVELNGEVLPSAQ